MKTQKSLQTRKEAENILAIIHEYLVHVTQCLEEHFPNNEFRLNIPKEYSLILDTVDKSDIVPTAVEVGYIQSHNPSKWKIVEFFRSKQWRNHLTVAISLYASPVQSKLAIEAPREDYIAPYASALAEALEERFGDSLEVRLHLA